MLGSARNRTDSTQAAFLEALGKTSVYCDFLSSLPAAYLADLMGLSTNSSLSIRALAAVEEKGQVILLLWDGGSHYYQCATAVQTSTLTEVLDHFELGVSTFAFEDSSGYGQRLSPLSLFPDPLPELPQLTLSAASVPTETLLSALGFNPHTNSRYQDASGAEVVVEGDRVIRISASGAFSYTSGGEAALSIDASGTEPTVREAVTGVQSLLDALTPEGEARLYLLSLTQNGSEATLTFGYQLGGVPIRFADGSPAAEVTLSGRAVSSLALTPRQYTSEAAAALLPLRQAMAIAGKDGGTELSIGSLSHLRRLAGGLTIPGKELRHRGTLPAEKHHYSDFSPAECLSAGVLGNSRDEGAYRPPRPAAGAGGAFCRGRDDAGSRSDPV